MAGKGNDLLKCDRIVDVDNFFREVFLDGGSRCDEISSVGKLNYVGSLYVDLSVGPQLIT